MSIFDQVNFGQNQLVNVANQWNDPNSALHQSIYSPGGAQYEQYNAGVPPGVPRDPYSGPSFQASLAPDSPNNIAQQRLAMFNQPGQQSDFSAAGSQAAGRPGQVWDPVTQSYRNPSDPPPGAVRTNNPNVYVLPNGSTWNTPGYSNNVTSDQQYDQFRQQTFGTGITGPATGAGIYQNTQGAGAGPTNLQGPGIPYSPNASPSQQALMATQPVQVAQLGYPVPTAPPPPQYNYAPSPYDQNVAPRSNGMPQQQFNQYNGGGYPLTPGMPGYVYQNQQPQQPPPQQQQQFPTDFLSFLASIFGGGGGQQQQQSVDPYNYYGQQQQYGNSNINQSNQPGGNQYVPTSAWDNFGSQGGWGNQGRDMGRAGFAPDTAGTLNPGQQTSGATTDNSSLSSQFSQPATSTDPWAGVTNRAADYGSSGSLWR